MTVSVPFVDLGAQYRSLAPELESAAIRAMRSGSWTLGPEVEAMEREFAQICGVRHAIGVSSGTAALHLALAAAGVGPGDEVITTPLTFIATATAIAYCGATPVFADVDPLTYTLDPEAVRDAITPRTRAIVPVHIYGQPADMASLRALAGECGAVVIEDAAQAHGATYRGQRTGGLADMGCFSFYPTKNIGALGEAGAVTTDDDGLAARLRSLRSWDAGAPYRHDSIAFNYRMDGIQGAILRVKLDKLDEWNRARMANAQTLRSALGDTGAIFQHTPDDRTNIAHIFTLRSPRRRQIMNDLSARGVATAIYYPIPLHLQPAFAHLGIREGALPCAERISREIFALPVFAEMTDAQRALLIEAALQAFDVVA